MFRNSFVYLIYPKYSCVYFNYHYNTISGERTICIKMELSFTNYSTFPFYPFIYFVVFLLKEIFVLFYRRSISPYNFWIHWRTNNTSRICTELVMCVVWWKSFGNIDLVQKWQESKYRIYIVYVVYFLVLPLTKIVGNAHLLFESMISQRLQLNYTFQLCIILGFSLFITFPFWGKCSRL